MNYRSARETAATWGVSERLVQRLCAEGRIKGAKKLGGSWIVPDDARKPDDPRKSKRTEDDSARPSPTVFGNLMPLMNTPFKPGTCQSTIDCFEDPSLNAIAQAEYCYFSGQAEEAARITGGLLSHDDFAVRLSARFIYAYANLPLGNISSARFALAELKLALRNDRAAAPDEIHSVEAFIAYAAAVLLHLPLPDGTPPVQTILTPLPSGLRMFALYVYAHQLYLQGDYARSLGIVEATLITETATYPISEIYLRMVAVMDCMSLKNIDEARMHLLAAWELARPDGLIEAFAEHHGLLGGMLESTIKKDWPEDFKRIIDITYRFSAGWRRVHNPATEETVADNLTTSEFVVSMLAARGWTNQEIGKHLGISANTVKSYLASSFRKLGISKRQELGRFMLK